METRQRAGAVMAGEQGSAGEQPAPETRLAAGATAGPGGREPGRKPFFSPAQMRVRWWFWLLLALFAAGFAAGYPPSFRWLVGALLRWDARRSGAAVELASVEGNVLGPVVLKGVRFDGPGDVGLGFRFDAREMLFRPNWLQIVRRSPDGWFSAVEISGAEAAIDLHGGGAGSGARREPGRGALILGRLFPASLKVQDLALEVKAGGRRVGLSGVRFETGELEEGAIEIARAEVRTTTFQRDFEELKGRTYLKGGRLELTSLRMADEIEVTGAAALLRELFAGVLQMEFQMRAFGGSLRGQARNVPGKSGPEAEVSGVFSGVSVERFAAFLGKGIDADGLIEEGKFTFRGRARNLDEASLTVRLKAVGFRWGKKEWDALVLGATLAERRVQIPELELKQQENSVSLSGEAEIPAAGDGRPWWDREFAFDVEAAIGDLGDLARLGPVDLGAVEGKIELSGSVRNKAGAFGGQLIAKGANLVLRGVPLDSLDGAIKLSGNELQVVNLTLVRGEDAVRSRGLLNLRGERQYWGELQAAVGELADYRVWWPDALRGRPLAGRVKIDWSGDGSAKYHSGAFRLAVSRLAGEGEGWPLRPLDGAFEGTYSPGHLVLTECRGVAGGVNVAAGVVVSPGAVEVRDLKIGNGKGGQLSGGFALPLDLWKTWPRPAWNPEGPISGKIEAKRFRLESLGDLLAHGAPWSGELTGAVEASGKGSGPVLAGAVSAKGLRLDGGTAFDGQFDFAGESASVSAWPVRVEFLPGLAGEGLASGRVEWAGGDLRASGKAELSPAVAEGKMPVALLLGQALWPKPRALCAGAAGGLAALELAVTTPRPVQPKKGEPKLSAELVFKKEAGGTESVAGSFDLAGLAVGTAAGDLTVTEGQVYWPGAGAEQPVLNLRAKGKIAGRSVEVYRAGEAVGGAAALVSEPSLPEEGLRRLLLEGEADVAEDAAVGLGEKGATEAVD